MALLVKANGTTEEITIPKENSLKFMQEKVGGWIQIFSTCPATQKTGYVGIVCDEEGKLKNYPLNPQATDMYGNPNDVIVGDAIFFKDGEVD